MLVLNQNTAQKLRDGAWQRVGGKANPPSETWFGSKAGISCCDDQYPLALQ